MRATVRGNLRQVRDAEHLNAIGQLLQPGPDDIGGCPADAGIDLVEDQRLAGRVDRTPGSSAPA